jgi:hypothetical protein
MMNANDMTECHAAHRVVRGASQSCIVFNSFLPAGTASPDEFDVAMKGKSSPITRSGTPVAHIARMPPLDYTIVDFPQHAAMTETTVARIAKF